MKKIIFTFLGVSILFLGIFVGIILENFRQSEQKIYNFSHAEISDKNIPVLTLEQIENGKISGIVSHGELRIILAPEDKKISVLKNETFSLDIREILPMLKEVPHPEGTQFVASKRGKKFYPIDSPRAFLITSKNRTFFKDESEAEEKGFVRY